MINFNCQQAQSKLPACGGETAGRFVLLDNSLKYTIPRAVGCGIPTRNSPVGIFALCMLDEKEIKK